MWAVFLLALFLMTTVGHKVESKFKSLHCNIYDPSIGEFPLCRIKALNRYKNTISVTFRSKKHQEKIMVRLEALKRVNGWRPFLYNITFDLCNFMEKRNNFYVNLAFSYLEPYLKLNYSCPLKVNDIIKCEKLQFDMEKIRARFPVETGEYGLRMGFYYKGGIKVSICKWFSAVL
nr:uncharacterized protein LOC108078299 [Drosophila kikkawai]